MKNIPTASEGWQVFDIAKLMEQVTGSEPRILEFLRVPSMSMAVYRLPAGSKDMQSPHEEDEVYIVLEGKARLRIGDDEQKVDRGKVLFVRANTTHSFFDIEEDLTVLAMFGPQ